MAYPPAHRVLNRRRIIALVAGLGLVPVGVAVTPQAAAAVSPPPPALTIVSTSTWTETIRDIDGTVTVLHLVGEVRNDDAAFTAQDILVTCQLLTSTGDELQHETSATDAAVLRPADPSVPRAAERSPFDVLFFAPLTYHHYGCSVTSASTTAEPNHNFDANITSVSTDPGSGAQLISGTVKNLDDVTVSGAQLFFTFYQDATSSPPQTIAEDRLWVNGGNPLPASSVTPFSLTRFDPPWNGLNAALLVEAPTPAVKLDPPAVSVMQVKTTTSDVQLVSLTNVGTGDLHIGTLTISGAHAAEWGKTDTCAGATITPFGSCSISLTLTPADVGDRSANLFVNDDANHTPQKVVLTGTGTDPKAVPSPSPLVFDAQVVNTTSAERTEIISNPGVGALHISTLALAGSNAADYAITADGCSHTAVAAGSSCQLKLTFSPSDLGTRSATLTVNDDALNSPQSLNVSGTGVASNVGFVPASRIYSFANQKISSTSDPVSISVTNKGTSTLTVSSVCSSSPEFRIASGSCLAGFSLSPGATQSLPVRFAPAQTGFRTGTLSFIDNSPDSPQHFALTGNGTFGGQFHPLAPVRTYDSRSGDGALGPGLQGAPDRSIAVTGVGGVPTDAIAVVLNVTVTNTTAGSYLTVYPTGVTRPTASSLNWVAGQTVPNLVEVGVGANDSVNVFNALGSANVIFDIAGYVTAEPDFPGPSGFFNPVLPTRVLDTRTAIGAPAGPLAGGHQLDVQLTGTSPLPPSGVTAVVLNVTVTGGTAPSYLTVFPTGSSPPVVSNLNFVPGQTVPNRVIVKVGNGRVSFYNAVGKVQVIADVGGWFTDTTPGGSGAGFTPLTPTRILDTRNGTGGVFTPVGQTPITLSVGGVGGIPGSGSPTPPKALVLNVTVTGATATSFLTMWPNQASRPNASDLNFVAGQTVCNLVVVKVAPETGGVQQVWKLAIFNAAGTTNVIVDVVGWYG